MANTIRIKRSTGSGAPTTLQNAELAFTEGTKTLYVGVGTGGGGGSATTVEAIGGLGAFVSLGSTAQTIEGVKTFTGAIVLGTPGSGTLTNCTGLPVSTGVSGLGTGVATFLATPSSANLASAVTGGTGTGALVFATSPTLVTPALGTPSALVGTNISGTGANFTAGAVTNAGLTGEVTTSGLAATISNSAVIGKVLTGFTSGAGTVAATDTILQAIQKINGNTSAGIAAAGSLTGATLASNVLASSLTSVGTLSGLTVTAPIVGSVTGNAATATTATNVTTNANLTGAITSSGNTTSLGTASFSSANLAGALTDETGSGSAVFATSPTLVTPTIGAATATSVNKVTITAPATGSTLTVAEGKTLTASNTLTFTGTDASSVAFGTGGTVVYTSGLGTGVATFLATPSSANLASAVTGETGTGSLVFSADPTFTGTLNCAALISTGNVTVGGDLVVNGTTTTVNSTVTTLDDPIITLGGDGNGINDDKDRGVEFKWNNGTAKVGFFGFDESTGYFTFIPQATNSSEVFTGTKGDIEATNFRGALIGNADTVTTNANLTGAITSSGNTTSLGTASFSSANLAGALTDKTGTGVAVFATSPTLVTPTLGVAAATSINKVTITAPATGSTITVADGKTLTVSNKLTFTSTDDITTPTVAFGSGGTVVYTSGLGTNVATFLATPSSANLISAVTGETGSGALVFGTGPSLSAPSLSGELYSTSATVTAGTNAIGQGAITDDINIITTTASNPSGVTLPKGVAGRRIIVVNKGTNAINVYPSAAGAADSIDALSIGASIQIPVNGLMEFNAATTSLWYSSANSTFTAPNLGTPTALVGTNISGTGAGFTAGTVTTNANLTGAITSSGNTTSLGTASFSSANLAGALTDKTGTGVAVFATSPTLVTPTLGEATASSLTVTGDVAVNGGDITTTALNATVFDTTATAIYLGTGAATDVRIGKSDNTGNTRLYGSVGINGGTLTTSTLSSSIFNTTATTLNLGGAATTLSIGAVTGTATINNANTVVAGDLAVNGGDITTTAATATLMNATATTLSIGGAATTLTLGATSGTTAIRNASTKLGNTTATLTTNSGTTNSLTINPYGSLILSPVNTGASSGGTNANLTITNTNDGVGTVAVTGGDLVLGTKSSDGFAANPVNIIFEGATNNVYDTTLTVVDPTANRTITLPDATDTLVGKATTDTLTNKTWNSTVIAGQYGGTGVANTGKTITLGGNLTTSGAFTTTLTATANTSVTLPTSGTLLNDAATIDGGSY